MSTTLTRDDLVAIGQLIDELVPKIIDERVPKIIDDLVPKIIDERVPALMDERVPVIMEGRLQAMEDRLVARIDNLDDTLSMQMEHGLQEVRDQVTDVDKRLSGEISEIKRTVQRIDRVQQAELERNDRQDAAIYQIRKNLHAV